MKTALLLLLIAFIALPASAQITLPVTFEESIDYELTDFGGNESQIATDPADASNQAVQSVRKAGAEGFAGTTVAETSGFSQPIPFAEGMTTMSLRVWTPTAGTPVRLKVEKVGDPTVSVEAELASTKSGEWETLVFDFANELTGTAAINFDSEYTKASVFFNFGEENAATATTYYWDDLSFGGESMAPPIELPITFEGTVDYELTDFGGNESQIVTDPTDATNKAVQSVRKAGAESFAGTTVAETSGFSQPIPFAEGATTMSLRVWTPVAGTPVRLKVEKVGESGVSVEAELNSTQAGAWETLQFDFSNQLDGTAAINFDAEYTKASVFFNFGEAGAATATTYYWDDLAFEAPVVQSAIKLPVTFEESIDYELTDFGGNESQIVTDPTDATNQAVQSVRKAGAESFAGTTVAETSGFADPIPFADGMTTMSVRVWTPVAGTPVRLKVEKAGDAGVSVESQVLSTKSSEWETLVFDFAQEVGGTPALNLDAEYTKASIFFNFGEVNATDPTTYYWDDLAFGGESNQEPIELPVTFEGDPSSYELTDFGGNASQIIVDPTDDDNMVVESVRTVGAAAFAGTTVAETSGFSDPIPFAEGMTTMSLRVWTPVAGTPVRLKVEKVGDPTVSVEAELASMKAGEWETLVFDFSRQLDGTAAINFASEYTKASVFFNFGEEGATTATTYYWDDLAFGGTPIDAEEEALLSGVRLLPNAPNPFGERTTIRFELPRPERVAVHVYSAIGQRVATLVDRTLPEGPHDVQFDASSLAAGTYFYRLQVGTAHLTRSMVIAR